MKYTIRELETFSVIGQEVELTNYQKRNIQISTQFWRKFNSNLKKSVSDTKHTVMKRSACRDILYQNIHFFFVLCSLSRQLSGSVSDQGRYASSNSGWFR